MKKFMMSLLGALFLSPVAYAAKEKVHTCIPTKPVQLVQQVILVEADGIGSAFLTLVKIDSNGQKSVVSDKGEYYDDMTYYGYYSEKLNAAIEFWDPGVVFHLEGQTLWLDCETTERTP